MISAEQERDELRARLERLALDLAASEQRVSAGAEFVARLSHELRTPLTAILGYAEILRIHTRGRLPPEQVHQIEIIERSGQALLRLITAAMDWSRIENGRMQPVPREFNLRELFEGFAEAMLPMADAKGLAFDLELDADCPEEFVTDPDLLQQVVSNLTSNAIKYTERGSVRLRVRCSPLDLRCDVTDTGPGIPRSEHGRVFEEFHRLQPRQEGTGLGLSITKGLVEVLGGRIRLDSEPGRGSRFEVAVPRLAPRAEPIERRQGSDLYFETGSGAGRILIVDDNADNRDLLRELLVEQGFAVDAVEDGRDCLEFLSRSLPDLIVMDMMMPQIDGFETTRRLRSIYPANKLPVIGVTALAGEQDRERVLAAGCNHCLTKPIDLRQLLHVIHTWIDGLDKAKSG